MKKPLPLGIKVTLFLAPLLLFLYLLPLWGAEGEKAGSSPSTSPSISPSPTQMPTIQIPSPGKEMEAPKAEKGLVPEEKRLIEKGLAPEEKKLPEKEAKPKEEKAEKVIAPLGEKPSRIEALLSGQIPLTVTTTINQFGYDLFRASVSTFAPLDDAPVGPDYIVGPGDSFKIHLWGRFEGTFPVTVDRNGEITIPKVGVIKVWGLNFGQLKDTLYNEISRYYQGFEMNVVFEKLRTIMVYVVGEVKVPGSYSISSLATLYNALFAAGGPTKEGTLREIRLIRNGKTIKTVDLYDFLLKGDKSQDERLQSGDTIFIPLIGPVAGIAGNVKKPAIYEMKGPMNLKDLIELAGGVEPMGYLQRVQVERVVAYEKRIVVDLNLSDLYKEGAKEIPLIQNGDMVKISPIAPGFQNIVYLEGHVKRSGGYEYKKGMKLLDLIPSYNELLPETYLSYADIIRLVPPDFHQKAIPFNLGRLLEGDKEQNLELETFDKIRIYPKDYFKDKPMVSIEGEVRKPGNFELIKDMRLKDLVYLAGDLKKDAFLEKAEVFRRLPSRELTKIDIILEKALKDDLKENILLQDEDRVVIHNLWEKQFTQKVSLGGAVNKPGEYPLTENMRIKDLIFTGGGLKKNAYLKETEILRSTIEEDQVKTEVIKIDLEKALAGDPSQNIILKDFDRLNVREISLAEVNKNITIGGEVKFPGTYPITKKDKLSALIERAGGFTEEAYLKGTIFTRESVRKIQQKRIAELVNQMEQDILSAQVKTSEKSLDADEAKSQKESLAVKKELVQKLRGATITGRMVIKLDSLDKFKDSPYNIELEDGDTVTFPPYPGEVTVLGKVYNPTSIVYTKGKSVNYYLNRVGGTAPNAEKSAIYVVKADGTVISRTQGGGWGVSWDSEGKRWVWGGFLSTPLDPGDTILVPEKTEIVVWRKELRDWTQVFYQIAVSAGVIIAAF